MTEMKLAELQGEIRTRLQQYVPLVSLLPSVDEIREDNWHGTSFEYPNLRIRSPMLTPDGDGNCSAKRWRTEFEILCFSKRDSSINTGLILDEVITALDGFRMEFFAGVKSMPVRVIRLNPVAPESETVWRRSALFRTIVHFP